MEPIQKIIMKSNYNFHEYYFNRIIETLKFHFPSNKNTQIMFYCGLRFFTGLIYD